MITKLKYLFAFFSLGLATFALGQTNPSDSVAQAKMLQKYMSAQRALSQSSQYFYALYQDRSFTTLGKEDSTLIHHYLSRPNAYADQYSHFLTSYDGIRKLNSRTDPLMIHGYRPSANFMKGTTAWQEHIHFSTAAYGQGAYRSTYNRPIFDGSFNSGYSRRPIPYYMQSNRYQYLSNVRENERIER